MKISLVMASENTPPSCIACRRRLRINGKPVFTSCCCRSFGRPVTVASLALGAAVLAGLAVVTACTPSPATSTYGDKITLKPGQIIRFADFTLRYTGQTHVKSEHYPPGFLYDNFIVTAGGREQTIRWSNGTGDIGPTPFTVTGKSFLLEMALSDIAGPLKPDEIIVWEKEPWEHHFKAVR